MTSGANISLPYIGTDEVYMQGVRKAFKSFATHFNSEQLPKMLELDIFSYYFRTYLKVRPCKSR